MAMRSRAMVPSTASRVIIRVDSYNAEGMAGLMRNPYLEKSVFFHDVVDFANKLDGICDEMSFPQAAATYRSFSLRKKKQAPAPPHTLENDEAAAAEQVNREGSEVFMVHIQFRQNATWQGTVKWAGLEQERRFRSTLELIRLMDGVLSDRMLAQEG